MILSVLQHYDYIARQETGWQLIKNLKDIEVHRRQIFDALHSLDEADHNYPPPKPNRATRTLLTTDLIYYENAQKEAMNDLIRFDYPSPDFTKLYDIASQRSIDAARKRKK